MSGRRAIAGRVAALGLFLLGAVAALARGGVSARGIAVCGAGSGLALALAVLRDRGGRTPRVPLFALLPLAIALAAALQCVPIPSGLLELLAPHSAALRFAPPAPRTAWAPISLDQVETLSAIAPALTLACALAAAALLARRPRAQLLLLAAPVAAALLQLGICAVRLAGQGTWAGSFVNRNHLAGLLMLGALAAAGAALSPPREEEPGMFPALARARPLWIASAAACAAGTWLTLSRGASGALVLGALVLFWLERRAGGERESSRGSRRALWLVAPLVLGALAALSLARNPLLERLQDLANRPVATEEKILSQRAALQVALEHPLLGVGRGAWRYVAEEHRSVPGELAFVYVEDEPLQLACELGIPFALAFVALAGLAWTRAAGRARSGLARGVVAGALALALQNCFDFNLEFAGVGLPFAIALGAAVADERLRGAADERARGADGERRRGAADERRRSADAESDRRPTSGWWRAPRAALIAVAGAAVPIALLPLGLLPWSAERESGRLVFEADDPKVPAEALLEDARAVVSRHPADWLCSLAPSHGLHLRSPRRTAEALAWAGRAQSLAPRAWRAHANTAAILLRAGRAAQARAETRLALDHTSAIYYGEVAALAARASETLDDLLEASPEDPFTRGRLVQVLRGLRRPSLARALAEEELALPEAQRSPEATQLLLEEETRLLLDARDFPAAEAAAEKLSAEDCGRGLLLAEARAAQHEEPARIEAPLAEALARCPSDAELNQRLFHARLARGDLAGAAALLDGPELASATLPFAGLVHLWRAELAEARRDFAGAMHERWLAALVAPDQPGLALDYANRLESQGDARGALVALRTLAGRASPEARAAMEPKIAELEKLRSPLQR